MSRPLRILHVTQPTDGGTAAIVRQIVEAEVIAGFEVGVACPPGDLATWAQDRVIWHRLNAERAPKLADLTSILFLRRLQLDYDVIHLHSSKAGALGRAAIASVHPRKRPKCIFTPHGWSWYVGGRGAAFYRRWERLAARWADIITPVSSSESQAGRSALSRTHWHKLMQIENGVDTTSFSPEGPSSPRCVNPLLVCVGRLCRQKGQDILIEALATMKHTAANVRLVGDGPLRREFEALAELRGVAERVHFVGAEDPRPHYRAADVVAIPSRWEGLPLVLLEAMACGAAIVASEEAMPSLCTSVLVLRAGSGAPELADALDSLLDNDCRRAELSAAARIQVTRHHESRAMTQRYLSVLEQYHRELQASVVPDHPEVRTMRRTPAAPTWPEG